MDTRRRTIPKAALRNSLGRGTTDHEGLAMAGSAAPGGAVAVGTALACVACERFRARIVPGRQGRSDG